MDRYEEEKAWEDEQERLASESAAAEADALSDEGLVVKPKIKELEDV